MYARRRKIALLLCLIAESQQQFNHHVILKNIKIFLPFLRWNLLEQKPIKLFFVYLK